MLENLGNDQLGEEGGGYILLKMGLASHPRVYF